KRIANGMRAYAALERVRADVDDREARELFAETWPDLGYGLLLKRYRDDVQNATAKEIEAAAFDTVPQVMPLFWTFRVMVALGFYFIGFFAVAFWLVSTGRIEHSRRFLKLAVWSAVLPWVAIQCGWFVAEFGRQPWVIEGVLPTFYAVSGLSALDLVISLLVFFVLYTALAIVGFRLLFRTIRKGPPEPDASGGVQVAPDAPETRTGPAALAAH